MNTRLTLALASLLLLVLSACDRSPDSTGAANGAGGDGVYALEPEETDDQAASGDGFGNTTLNPGTPESPGDSAAGGGGANVSGGGTGMPIDPPSNEATTISFAGLTAPVPAKWIVETPTSAMRAVQLRVPGADGAGDAGFVVFTGISGSIEDNVARWVGQFAGDGGAPVTPRIDELTIGDLHITTATLAGTYTGGMVPADSGPGKMMVQSIVERPDGSMIFIRLLGPLATVEANRADFDAMLAGIR